ncbi:hypothetical protein MHTCC0001_01140 [Flavobacteriaceae bacterium MHTCC 0001]
MNTKTPKSATILIILLVLLFFNCKSPDDEIVAGPESEIVDKEKNDNEDNTEEQQIEPIACEECTHIVNSWKTDGEALDIKPGDIICLDANQTYSNLLFTNIVGTQEAPIIIKNCGEQVVFINPDNSSYGVKFQYSNNFKLLGNGGGGDYGIKISTEKGFFLSMQTYTTDFEIANVEIAGKSINKSGFAGIGIKTSPYEDCENFTDPSRTSWIMRNIIVRDNYIHDTDGEGLYIGHGFYNGRVESDCTEKTYSHSIKGVRIYNNLIENVGYDGIQIKNCDADVKVYNNIINGYGQKDNGAHDEGLYIGDGTTGAFYNNKIINGVGTGIQCHGMGNLDIYNNVIVNAGDYAFFAASGPHVYRFPDGYFNIFNNTFHAEGDKTFAFFGDQGGVKRLKNNILVAPNASEIARKGVALDSSHNIFTADKTRIKFTNFSEGDFTLKSDSPAVDKGVDLSEFGITDDILATGRPQGSGYDLGAYEYKD